MDVRKSNVKAYNLLVWISHKQYFERGYGLLQVSICRFKIKKDNVLFLATIDVKI